MAFETIPALAYKLINKYGTSSMLITTAEGTYNPASSTTTNVDASPVILKGIVEEYADSIRFLGNKLEKNDTIIQGDKKYTIAALGLAIIPKAGDKLSLLGDTYSITGVALQTAADNVAYYVLHIRKA